MAGPEDDGHKDIIGVEGAKSKAQIPAPWKRIATVIGNKVLQKLDQGNQGKKQKNPDQNLTVCAQPGARLYLLHQ